MITLLCTGKTKTSFVKDGIIEYSKRLSRFTKVQVIEKDIVTFPKDSYIIALDERGKQLSSLEFAQFIKKTTLAQKDITFLIGPATGLPPEIKKQCNASISLSQMTFPNELVRVIFLEQLYRAFTIIENHPYHKE